MITEHPTMNSITHYHSMVLIVNTIEYLEMNFTENDMNDEDAIVDMEGELISALEEIDRLRLKKRKQKQLLIQYETNERKNRTDSPLIKLEMEEAKKIEDVLKQQLAESKSRCE